jgi:hypothetical protein
LVCTVNISKLRALFNYQHPVLIIFIHFLILRLNSISPFFLRNFQISKVQRTAQYSHSQMPPMSFFHLFTSLLIVLFKIFICKVDIFIQTLVITRKTPKYQIFTLKQDKCHKILIFRFTKVL